jgi:hypothetical protein
MTKMNICKYLIVFCAILVCGQSVEEDSVKKSEELTQRVVINAPNEEERSERHLAGPGLGGIGGGPVYGPGNYYCTCTYILQYLGEIKNRIKIDYPGPKWDLINIAI